MVNSALTIVFRRIGRDDRSSDSLHNGKQRRTISTGAWSLIGDFTDIEGSKRNNRPALIKAMEQARLTGSVLVIAKLDRLSRDAASLMSLRGAGIEFVVVDMPNANRLTVGIMALVAQQEREAIFARTKAALAASKARGTALGGWRGGPKVDSSLGRKVQSEQADAFAARVMPLVRLMQGAGKSLRQIAAGLTNRGVRTARGGAWTAASLRNLIGR